MQVYRWGVQMTTSILHRATGIVLPIGLLAMVWGLLSLAAGPDRWLAFTECVGSPLGMVILFGFSWALAFHLINGIRHLVWDAGYCLDIPSAEKAGKIVIAAAAVLTVITLIFAF